MSNKILFGNEARAKLKDGVDIVFKATSPTLGAAGRNAIYNKWSRVPIVTNDGVSIAREVEPEDLGELQGANLIKQVSERTNDECGDGTTTSIVIAHSIIEEGTKLLSGDSKVNPMKLRRELKDATEKIVAKLKESAKEVSTLEDLENIATISVESPEIGKTIAKAIFDAGDSGVVYVSESPDIGVSIEKIEGYQFLQGMATPYLITDSSRQETVLNNPAILITDIQLMVDKNFLEIIKVMTTKTKDILIICNELHPDVLKFAVSNLVQLIKGSPTGFKMAIVKKPMQANYIEDIAALVGAEVVSEEKGKRTFLPQHIGTAESVVINMKSTTIFGGAGITNHVFTAGDVMKTDTALNLYIKNLKSQVDTAEDEVTKQKVKERLAKLTEGVYMLNVGDKTEAESKYLKMKVEDAVSATRAAREEGIVAGGGMALWLLGNMFDSNMNDGEAILQKACAAPLRQIVENSGESYEDIISKLTGPESGFNALTLEVVPDIIKAGIIDPVKVTRNALENASSFAGLLLTTEVLITPIPQKDPVLPI